MFGVERMAMTAAVPLPEMIVVNFSGSRAMSRQPGWKHLPVNGSVFCLHPRRPHFWPKFGRDTGTVFLADHKFWSDLYEETLFKSITHPIVIRINL
jgi:hypothetical protein